MELESYIDRSEPGLLRIRGHRIDLAIIVKLFCDGASPEQIIHEYPTLSLEEIYGAITYYLHNRAEIDRYVREAAAETEREYQESLRGPQAPAAQRIRALLAQQRKDHAA